MNSTALWGTPRPAMTASPVGSTRTTSKVGSNGSDAASPGCTGGTASPGGGDAAPFGSRAGAGGVLAPRRDGDAPPGCGRRALKVGAVGASGARASCERPSGGVSVDRTAGAAGDRSAPSAGFSALSGLMPAVVTGATPSGRGRPSQKTAPASDNRATSARATPTCRGPIITPTLKP